MDEKVKSIYLAESTTQPVIGVRALEDHLYFELQYDNGHGVRGFVKELDIIKLSLIADTILGVNCCGIPWESTISVPDKREQEITRLEKELIEAKSYIMKLELTR